MYESIGHKAKCSFYIKELLINAYFKNFGRCFALKPKNH